MSAKASRRRPRVPGKVKVAFGNDDDKADNEEMFDENNSTLSNQITDKNNGDVDMERSYQKAFFTINNTTVEVILDNDILSWSTVIGETPDETSRKKHINRDNTNSVNLQDVFAVSPIHSHLNWSLSVNENIAGTTVSTASTISSTSAAPPSPNLSETLPLRGFQLHSYQTVEENMLQEILIIFQSNESSQIERWYQFLSKIISEYNPTRHILVICNPYAGPRQSRHIYNTKIKTMLERAHYKITYTEIGDQYSADDVLQNFEGDFDSIDSLVIIGGDGSVINVINALIRYLAKENRTRLDMENDLPSIPFPICIIPDGTTNIICHTIQGNTDHCTALLHLIFNKRMKIDMSAIFDIDYNFVTANFSASAGYPANVLKYFPRYSLHNPKNVIKKSFSKAASNKNLQPIEIEIRYIPAGQNDVSISRCYRGCPSCTPAIEKSDDQVKIYDDSHIQKVPRKKKSSSSNNDNNKRLLSAGKNSNRYNEEEKNWKILHHEYLQVAILTNANLWSFAPQGLAKFGHLADGLLDLILIEPVIRKEFLRYVKRNGNSKNQYDLPFTKLMKVKEIEIELKSPNDNFSNEIDTDNQLDSSPSDDSSNENMSDTENNKTSGLKKHQPHPPSAPISEDSLRNRHRRRRINQQTQESSSPTLYSSKSMDASILQSKTRSQQQSESEIDSPQIDPYGSTTSLRRTGIFRSLKLKKDKIPLPRPSSAHGRETDDEKQQKKTRKSFRGTLRPARSLLNLLTSGNSSSGKIDRSSTITSRDSFSAGTTGRRPSVISRSSSVDNSKTSDRNKKKPCMWNLDFTPYNSPLIRIKCFYRYLTVYGVGLDPDTRIKEINYSCFGRIR